MASRRHKGDTDAGIFISTNEARFISSAMEQQQLRVDGRQPLDMRSVRISFGMAPGEAEVQLGQTRVTATVSCSIVPPFPERPNDGFLAFNVDLSPMGDPAFPSASSGQRAPEAAIEITRVIDRAVRGSRSIDTEALCIVSGKKVWSIRVDIRVVDHWGNMLDCAHLAAMAALLHFRRPEVTISGGEVVVHGVEDREPVPLSIHHIPICISYGLLKGGEQIIADPSLKEEEVIEGVITFALNVHSEVCAVQKGGGVPVPLEVIVQSAKNTASKVTEITQLLRKTLDEDAERRRIEKLPAFARK